MKALTPFVVMTTILLAGTPSFALQADEAALKNAVEHPIRSTANKARDIYRNPVATLSFFEVKPTSTVVEISPGGGWYTEILAPLLKDKGIYYAAHHPADASSDFAKKSRAAFIEKLAADPVYSAVKVTSFAPVAGHEVAPAGSADVVLTFRNLHNWYMQKGDESVLNAYKSFYAALKPGGVLGVVEHRLPADQLNTDWSKTGYMPQSLAIKLAEQAGFVLEATSEINANPKDTANHPRGVWTLPPSLALKEENKDKYLAIGESDRMTLKFRKPKAQ